MGFLKAALHLQIPYRSGKRAGGALGERLATQVIMMPDAEKAEQQTLHQINIGCFELTEGDRGGYLRRRLMQLQLHNIDSIISTGSCWVPDIDRANPVYPACTRHAEMGHDLPHRLCVACVPEACQRDQKKAFGLFQLDVKSRISH